MSNRDKRKVHSGLINLFNRLNSGLFLEKTSFMHENSFTSLIFKNYVMRRWFSGRILACHAGGPGSIPGRRIILPNFILSSITSFNSIFVAKKTIFNFSSNSNHLEILFEI